MSKITFETFCVFVVLFLFALGVYGFYLKIYIPSQMSVDLICDNDYSIEELQNNSKVAGYYNPNTDEVYVKTNVTINNSVYKLTEKSIQKTIRHEIIHKIQSERHYSYSCNQRFFFRMNEMEAYFMSNFNEKTLNFIYRTNNF